jgi:hypothetical protein
MNQIAFDIILMLLAGAAVGAGILAVFSLVCDDIVEDPEDYRTVESRKPAPLPGMTDRDLAEWEARNNVPAHQRSFPAGEPQ